MTTATDLDFSRCREVIMPDGSRSPVKAHVKDGVRALLDHPFFMLGDEMGAMKTAQTIIAACFLYEQGVIDRVVVVAPASVRPVWFDEELGELQKHLFVPSLVIEFHAKTRHWHYGPDTSKRLRWTITNYEYIRGEQHLKQLVDTVNERTLLVLDESSAIKSHRAAQTKACFLLRRRCGRVVLLNGTPIANSPMDLWSQGQIMHPCIINAKSFFHFRARYAIMGGWQQKQIIGYVNLDDLQKRFKPYVLRRLKKDCLDLPPVLPPITLTAVLTPATWKIYKDMRQDMVAWLESGGIASSTTAGVKALRLAQITSGFVGGVEAGDNINDTQEVGREKLDLVLDWWQERLTEDPDLKLLVWCRFRAELDRLLDAAMDIGGSKVAYGRIHGGQAHVERNANLRLLHPETAPKGAVFFGGTYGTGALGLNFTACHTVMNMSYDFSFWKKLQGDARVDRPGQTEPVSMFDVVAVGPAGQKTLDHAIIKARHEKEDVATWTTAAWIRALTDE